jgi:S-adenosylmethionine-diacylgycerolhomoserine-N-methlytransferase
VASEPVAGAESDAASSMDRMYRYTRHVYDVSRKYYLLGRDGLLDRLADEALAAPRRLRIVEVGCGTGRNLIGLAGRLETRGALAKAELFGVDAASVMIDTARRSVERKGLGERIHLTQGLAQELSPRMVGLDDVREEGWCDAVFFSYSLSMIPPWKASVEAALRAVRRGGSVWVVDFCDQAGLPRPFAWGLKRWLAMFHVHYRPELVEHFNAMRVEGRVAMAFEEIGGRYAYRVRLVKPGG